jgi:hypothetical protein
MLSSKAIKLCVYMKGNHMQRISNSKAKPVVNSMEEFKGSNTFAVWKGKVYAVYSYGEHFPIYVYDSLSHAWFGNYEKYSQSTSKHQSQLRPSGDVVYKNTWFLKNVIYDGLAVALDKV